MSTILEFLSAEHRECDDLFAAAEEAASTQQWSKARELFGQFQEEMSRHFAKEEDVLFPAFEECTGMRNGPTQVMHMEHDQMRGLMADMAAAVQADNLSAYLGASETLNMVMQQHNTKEETMLYPMSDRALAAECDTLIHSMEAVAH